MRKRLLSLLAAAVFVPLLSASALTPCEHFPGQVTENELVESNLIPAKPGVDGSVDLVCPICGQIVDTDILPALPAEAEHPAASDDEIAPSVPETVQQDPEPAAVPQPQAEPEPPAEPEPAAEQALPAQPEPPAVQAGQAGSSIPAGSGIPPQPQADVRPEAEDTAGNVQASSSGSTQSGSVGAIGNANRANTGGKRGTDRPAGEKPQSFPFRRIKMKPKKGIRAEAPGELLWPVYGTPFQNLYNN